MNNIDLKVRGGVKRRLEVHQTPSSSSASPSSSSSINRSPGPLRKQLNSGHHRSKIPSVTVKLPGTVFNPSNDSRILLKSPSPSSTTALSVKASNGGTTSTCTRTSPVVQAVEATKETLSASSLTSSPSYFCPSPSNGTGSTNSSISGTNGSLLQHCLSFSKIRQLVFNLSMCKLSRYRQTPDPSLFKSVLICNTLKRLERELDREGIRINFGPNGVSFVPVASPLPVSSSSSTVTSVAPNDSSPSSSSPATSSPSPSSSSPSSSSSCSSVLQTTLMTPASFAPQSSSTSTLSPVSCSSPSASEADISKNTYSVSDMDVTPSGRITPFPSTHSLEGDEEDCPMEDSDDSAMDQSSTSSSSSCSSSSSSSDDSDSGLWSPEPCTGNSLSLPNTSSASLDPVNRVSSWTDSLLALNCIPEEECPSSSNACLSKEAHSSVTNYSCPETTIVNDAEETTENNREIQSDVHRNDLPSQSCLERPSEEAGLPPTDSPPLLHLLQCPHQDPSSSSSPSSSNPSSSSKSSEPTSFPEPSQIRDISLKESSLPTSSVLMASVSENVSSLASSSSSSMTTTIVAASSTVTSDELFGDIDLSLYDFDLLSPLAAPNEHVKLTPVSEEELMSTVISSQNQEEQRQEKRDFTPLSCNNNNEENLSTTSVLTPSMTSSSTTCCTSSSTSFASVESSSSPATATMLLTEALPVPSSTLSDPSSEDSSSSPPSSPSSFSSSTSPTSSTTSTTCATQSSTATVVFSKLFMNKTEGSMYLDEMPTVIS